MRVLIAEDDAALSMFLTRTLEQEGHRVSTAADGRTALECVLEQEPDILLLDLGLPRMDGVDVLRALQGRADGIVVLVLTGRTDLSVRVECLDLGADDVMTKPFSMFELLARVRAICRRRQTAGDTVLRAGAIQMDRISRAVTCYGEPLDFTAKEYLLLEYLLQRKGQPVSRRELLANVWQMSPEAGTNVVDVYVNYLRRKLAAVGAHDAIRTIRGEGYAINVSQQPALPVFTMRPVQSAASSFSSAAEVA